MNEAEPDSIRLMIIAPMPTVRAGLRTVLGSDPRLIIRGEASNISQALDWFSQIDLLLIADLDTPIQAIFHNFPPDENIPSILLMTNRRVTLSDISSDTIQFFGILPLEAGSEEILAAVHAVHAGLWAISPQISNNWFTNSQKNRATDMQDVVQEDLTSREMQILQLLSTGLTNKEIALELNISAHTAKFHISSIFSKLGSSNRAEAVRLGVKKGIISI